LPEATSEDAVSVVNAPVFGVVEPIWGGEAKSSVRAMVPEAGTVSVEVVAVVRPERENASSLLVSESEMILKFASRYKSLKRPANFQSSKFPLFNSRTQIPAGLREMKYSPSPFLTRKALFTAGEPRVTGRLLWYSTSPSM
jgi:hypothetical protein